MRNELILLELADGYLRGELNAIERAELEERMRTNPEIRELVEDHRTLLGGMQRLALRPAVDKAYRSYRFGKWAPGIGGAVVAAILISGTALLMTGGHETSDPTNTELIPAALDTIAPAATEAPSVAPAEEVRHTQQVKHDTVIMIMRNGVLTPIAAKDTVGKGTLRTVKTVPITASSPAELKQRMDSVRRAGATEPGIPAKAIPKDSLILLLDGAVSPRIE